MGIIKVMNLVQKSGLLIDSATETGRHEIWKQEGGFLGEMMTPMAASIIAPMVSSVRQPVASSWTNAEWSHESNKRTRKLNSSLISIAFNDKNSVKKI